MLLTLILFFFGPILVLLGLGLLSIQLTFSGYIGGRPSVGWTIAGTALAIFLACTAGLSRISSSSEAMFGALFHIMLLGLLLALQAPLVIELVSQLVVPDPSRGLKLMKSYSEAETRVAAEDLTGAIKEYEKVLSKDSGDVTARLRLAELRCQNGEYRRAAADYEALLAHPKKLGISRHCSALTRLSEIYSQHLDDIENARKHIRTIMDTYPKTKYADYASEHLKTL